jgi:hypothetical protein
VILGLSAETLTVVHVAVSLTAIASGIAALPGSFRPGRPAGLTAVFLLASAASSITGFFFQSAQIGMGHLVGAVSLIVLAPTVLALYRYRLAGWWRWVYLTGAATLLYLNAFIGVRQAFGKIEVLRELAPTPSEPAFLFAHLVVLAIVVALAVVAARRFSPSGPEPADLAYPRSRPRSWSRAMHDEQVSAVLQSSTGQRR